jgi:hypothetical protein
VRRYHDDARRSAAEADAAAAALTVGLSDGRGTAVGVESAARVRATPPAMRSREELKWCALDTVLHPTAWGRGNKGTTSSAGTGASLTLFRSAVAGMQYAVVCGTIILVIAALR